MKLHFGCTALLVWGLLVSGNASAQVPLIPGMVAGEGISVYGTGEVAARPNWVEIDLVVSGKAELTGDALVKYRDARKRLVDSLAKLGLADLSTEELGVGISAGNSLAQQQRIINGVPQAPGKTQIEVASTVRVRLKNVREAPSDDVVKTVGRLIDIAQDAGVSIELSQAEIQMRQRYGNYSNQNVNVQFVVSDLAELRERAYEQAVADARERAARLAKLNRVKLGAAVSVQEIQVAGDSQAMARSNNPYAPSPALETSKEPRISSATLADIPVQVKLLVRFAIEPADPATAQK